LLYTGVSDPDGHYVLDVEDTSGRNGSITADGNALAFNTSSDYRLKIVKSGIIDGLDRLLQLNPVRFNWKDFPDRDPLDGFIAHEIAEVIPESVHGEKDAVDEDGNIEAQQLDYGRITPLLVAAIQELSEKVEDLQNEINELKGS